MVLVVFITWWQPQGEERWSTGGAFWTNTCIYNAWPCNVHASADYYTLQGNPHQWPCLGWHVAIPCMSSTRHCGGRVQNCIHSCVQTCMHMCLYASNKHLCLGRTGLRTWALDKVVLLWVFLYIYMNAMYSVWIVWSACATLGYFKHVVTDCMLCGCIRQALHKPAPGLQVIQYQFDCEKHIL